MIRILPLLILLTAMALGCSPEEIHIDNNPVPPYSGVPTVKLDAYLTRVYIDLIGREPLSAELTLERERLRQDDLSVTARLDLAERLMGQDTAFIGPYDRKLIDDLSGRFLDGINHESLIAEVASLRSDAFQDSLAGGNEYPQIQAEANRLDSTVQAVYEFRSGTIGWREVNRRHCDNPEYDIINMNSFNFVNATFDDLLGRYPTEAEFEQAYTAVEFNSPAVLFGGPINDKPTYLQQMVNDLEFEDAAIRWSAERLLVRPITGAEIAAWREVTGPQVDIRLLQKLLVTSDEYADFE